ncbi:dockerin type I repeat-containing protein [Ruminococcus difficilis]|uniref:Dockerin type I repeat-containing protein n=1 Tax=Ruminococcus difficilis TaxID=2763069 RepID=A0A934WRI8_9FIRM|nr:dockerin type I repeat-containing protein [Ruminococcus difficilis]MBK6088175.1 dockerin type I repeat-containing protein [Ruminococcus difficilis]
MKKVLSLLLATTVLLSCLAVMTVSAEAVTKLPSGYYVVGSFNNWTLDKAYRMHSEPYDCDNDKGDYYILKGIKLNTGDELKVGYTESGLKINAWYPDSGPQTNYIIPKDSYYNIAFALPTDETLGDWDWQLWVEPCDPPTDVSQPVDPEPVIDRTKQLWDDHQTPTAGDIEEAVNEQFNSRTWIEAEDIMVFNTYCFDSTPAYVVDFGVKGYGIYCEVITEECFGDYLFWSASSYEPSIYVDNKLYTFTKAYQAGVLTQEMLQELLEANYRGGGYYGENSCRILPVIKGDADGDGDVSIIDATCVQRHEAGIATTSFFQPLADVDGDSEVSVIDATLIQRSNAGLYTIE